VVNSTTGVHLAYLDTGPPENTSSYTTIFAVHGMVYTNLVFQKVMGVASSNGVRFVATKHRPCLGSTLFTDEELDQGNFEIEMRGHEIASFVDIPRVSDDGMSGGVSLLGWSVRCGYVVVAIASIGTLPVDVQTRLGAHVRFMIIYEAAPIALGLPTPSQNWAPLVDTTIPEDLQLPTFVQWHTGYFDHGNLTLSSAYNLDSLSWVLTAPEYVPTFYKIPVEELEEVARYRSDEATDPPFIFFFANQLNAVYRKAFNDEGIGAILPLLKGSFLCGDKTSAFHVSGLWTVHDDQVGRVRRVNTSWFLVEIIS
ncbi:hypothetical protein EDD18DRAFT_1070396, partial [Armillaria luteobubalina]